MIHLYDRETFASLPSLDLDTKLMALLTDRISTLPDDLIDYTEYVVVQAGDTEQDIVRNVGFSPLIEPIDGARFGTNGFQPYWDWLAYHGGWFELIFTFGSTFSCIVFVQDDEGASADLLNLCRAYAPT